MLKNNFTMKKKSRPELRIVFTIFFLGRTADALFEFICLGTSAHAHCLLTKVCVEFERADDQLSEPV